MAYKEVFRVEITEIIRRWQAGATVRGLARASGLSRNTIKKYILAAEREGLTRDGPPPTEDQVMSLVQINIAGRRRRPYPPRASLARGRTRSTGG
jgi:predicted transcriptional regulator